MKIALLDDGWVIEQHKDRRLRLELIELEDSTIITSPTQELQKFALQHAKDKRAFSFERSFCRMGNDGQSETGK